MASYIFGSNKKAALVDELGQLTSDFRKKRSKMMDKLVPVVFEAVKTEILLKAAKQNKNSVTFDLSQFHCKQEPHLDEDEKLELSNRIAKLFDQEGLDVQRNITKDGGKECMWSSITVTWPVTEDDDDASEVVELVERRC